MGKDPAFLFYPGDWLGGTMGMTFEQKGAYMELLMMQFNRGHMTNHMIGQTVGQHWVTLQDKFIQDKDGLWYNARLDDEKEKRKNFVSSRNNNIKGENQYTKTKKKRGHKVGHMTSHMENENENRNVIEIGIKKEFSISIRSKYLNEPVMKIYDMAEYFKEQGQLEEITRAGWSNNFEVFMTSNPGRVFDDSNHLYNSLKKFKPEERNGKTLAFDMAQKLKDAKGT